MLNEGNHICENFCDSILLWYRYRLRLRYGKKLRFRFRSTDISDMWYLLFLCLSQKRGELYFGLGVNGCGKSALLAVLGNREVPIQDHIDIYYLGQDIVVPTVLC